MLAIGAILGMIRAARQAKVRARSLRCENSPEGIARVLEHCIYLISFLHIIKMAFRHNLALMFEEQPKFWEEVKVQVIRDRSVFARNVCHN